MSETNGSQQKEKATKVRRKPEQESVLTPTFAAGRHSTSGDLWDRNQPGTGLLQRQCACGAHTIAGGECDACRKKGEAGFLQRVAVRSMPGNTTPPGLNKGQAAPRLEGQPFPELDFDHDFCRVPAHTVTSPVQPGDNQGMRVQTNILHRQPVTNHFSPGFPVLQRYDSFEHAQLGDNAAGAQNLTIRGISVSMGEVNALADFYEHPQDLMDANPTELRQLVRLIRQQRANPDSVSEGDWETATGGRYTELAERNSAHFAPQNAALAPPQASTPTSGQDHRSVWIMHHRQALTLARHAALVDNEAVRQDVLNEARVVNSFADHYLSDAFSAGHLFNKDDVMTIIQNNLSQLSEDQLDRLFSTVATTVFNQHRDLISQYEADIPGPWWPNLNSAGRFQSLLEGIYQQRPSVVHNAIVKAAHDELNTWPGGVPVENDYATWNLSGDDSLATSPETQHWAQEAIATARANLETALEPRSMRPNELDEMVEHVLTYFPRPTSDSTTMIHQLLERVTDPQGGMAAAISQVLSSQIRVVLEAVVAEGSIRPVVSPAERQRQAENERQMRLLRRVFIDQDPEAVNWFIRGLTGI